MPRSVRVPSYRLHKATGQAVVTLSGRDHYLGRHGTPQSAEAYARLVAEWSAGGGRAARPDRSADLSVSEVLSAYLAFAEGYYRKGGAPTSQLDRVRRSLAPARLLYGSSRAADFGPRALKACRQQMVGGGLCRDQVNKRVGCLVRAFKWAGGEELIPPATYHGLLSVEPLRLGRTEAPESAPVLPAPEASIEATLRVVSPVLADAMRCQLLTGARPGEALSLEARHLDRAGDVWLWRPPRHKTQHRRRDRVLFVGPRCQEVLAPYLLRRPEGCLFSPRESMEIFRARQRAARASGVQPSQADRSKARPKKQPGERYAVTSYDRAVAAACARAEVAHFSPHQLRHNAATRLVAQFGWEVARIVLGHRSVDATRIYAEDELAKAIAAIRQVG